MLSVPCPFAEKIHHLIFPIFPYYETRLLRSLLTNGTINSSSYYLVNGSAVDGDEAGADARLNPSSTDPSNPRGDPGIDPRLLRSDLDPLFQPHPGMVDSNLTTRRRRLRVQIRIRTALKSPGRNPRPVRVSTEKVERGERRGGRSSRKQRQHRHHPTTNGRFDNGRTQIPSSSNQGSTISKQISCCTLRLDRP